MLPEVHLVIEEALAVLVEVHVSAWFHGAPLCRSGQGCLLIQRVGVRVIPTSDVQRKSLGIHVVCLGGEHGRGIPTLWMDMHLECVVAIDGKRGRRRCRDGLATTGDVES